MHESTVMTEATVAATGLPKERGPTTSEAAAAAASTVTTGERAAFVTKSIMLQRQHHHQGYGFCLRGGVEHGVGHFVSSVDEGSIAEAQGIVAGDQIICVDGLPLMTATHKEAVAFISIRNKLKLQIKRMGVIPTKKSLGESIEWIHCDREVAKSLMKQDNIFAIEKLLIDLGDDVVTKGLGCSICKGPPERPGIYVQSIKSGGAAYRSGLQLGDQILACNDMTFEGNNLNFNVAVAQMRGRRFLDLIIRRGAGLDILANEAQMKNNQEERANRAASHHHHLLEDEKRLLQSQVQLERRKLEAEQERLRVEALRLENERMKLMAEKEKLLKSAKKTNSTTSTSSLTASTASTASSSSAHPSSSTDNSSLESSSSGGGLASAIQSELKRRAQANYSGNKTVVTYNMPKPIIKANLTENGKKSLLMQHNDQHDQLIAEFRKVHRKLFSSNNLEAAEAVQEVEAEDTEEAKTRSANKTEAVGGQTAGGLVHHYGNRSYDETLVKPTKTIVPNIPSSVPPPPPRMESSPAILSSFKSDENSVNSDIGSPGIPTPDYDTMTTIANSSPEPKNSIEINRMRISSPEPSTKTSSKILVKKAKSSDPRTKTFSKRHPTLVETVSSSSGASSGDSSGPLSSFKVSKAASTENLDGPVQEKVPTANYFELVRHVHAAESEAGDQFNFGPSQMQQKDKNVRFNVSSEAAVAATDYRIAHATRRALKCASELHKTFAVRSGVVPGVRDNAGTASNSVTSSGVSSSPSRSSPRCLSSSEEEAEILSDLRRVRARSPKKYPAPPPPPPPPKSEGCRAAVPQDKGGQNASTSNLLPKNVIVKGID